jgi:hypothetical protein
VHPGGTRRAVAAALGLERRLDLDLSFLPGVVATNRISPPLRQGSSIRVALVVARYVFVARCIVVYTADALP